MSNEDYSMYDDCELMEKLLKNAPRDVRDIMKSFRIEQEHDTIRVIAVAIHPDFSRNSVLEISASSGVPLCQEVFDVVRDSIHVEGVDYYEIGYIPVAYKLYMDDTNFYYNLPLPFSVIKRYMQPSRKKQYEAWLEKYKETNCTIQFVQFLETY